MTVFWLAATVLTIVALAIIVLPLWKQRQSKSVTQTELNKTLYKDRLVEIEQENQQGLAEDSDVLVSELQHNLLDDIPEETAKEQSHVSAWVAIPGVVFIIALSIGMYASLGGSKQVQDWQDIVQQMPELSNKVLLGEGGEVTEQDLSNFALGLRTKLHNDPSDTRGWFLLAKVGQALNRLDIMMDAAEQAYMRDSNSANIVAVYVQSLFYSGEPNQAARAERILVLALQKDSSQLELWSLYAFMALEQQQFQLAIDRWQTMQGLVDVDSERYQMLGQSIEFAKGQIAAQQQSQPAEVVSVDPVVPSGPSYSITVDVKDGLAVPDSSFLFVFAKSVNGPPMPLAAKKVAHPRFPVTVNLSDSDSMMEGLKLSQQGDFYITARLSYDNNVQTTDGDWEGKSSAISQGGDSPIQLVIDTQL
ncbi:c-type cytochrome biogenesis protein CcmI [Agarivorans sp. 1_MG-2023]|uniref:c-type cytochrome biogenesis protein CcmI n=1 Tax=Agarivorans sp. 1_MG-2023 TaxID=3062634 RepID=UPI0026E36100|nr:c-type cytochrome biogenesis protein CcmI [Agarivorans sp. 1_MG-2023]MDO6764776.1 c-type cytochrome biogenesis protein CcmI [Agarivorans sp. 1_MG-2023]